MAVGGGGGQCLLRYLLSARSEALTLGSFLIPFIPYMSSLSDFPRQCLLANGIFICSMSFVEGLSVTSLKDKFLVFYLGRVRRGGGIECAGLGLHVHAERGRDRGLCGDAPGMRMQYARGHKCKVCVRRNLSVRLSGGLLRDHSPFPLAPCTHVELFRPTRRPPHSTLSSSLSLPRARLGLAGAIICTRRLPTNPPTLSTPNPTQLPPCLPPPPSRVLSRCRKHVLILRVRLRRQDTTNQPTLHSQIKGPTNSLLTLRPLTLRPLSPPTHPIFPQTGSLS